MRCEGILFSLCFGWFCVLSSKGWNRDLGCNVYEVFVVTDENEGKGKLRMLGFFV